MVDMTGITVTGPGQWSTSVIDAFGRERPLTVRRDRHRIAVINPPGDGFHLRSHDLRRLRIMLALAEDYRIPEDDTASESPQQTSRRIPEDSEAVARGAGLDGGAGAGDEGQGRTVGMA